MNKNKLVVCFCFSNLWGKSCRKINTFVENLILVLSLGKILLFVNGATEDYCCNDLKLVVDRVLRHM